MPHANLIRTLAWYELDPGDSFVDEVELKGADLQSLQLIFAANPDDLMYDCFPVNLAHVTQLRAYVDIEIDLTAYAYFVECRTK